MKSFLPILFFICCCLQSSLAQQGIYIPAGGKVAISGTLPVTFWQNTLNDGLLGSAPGSNLYFLGKQWTNGTGAVLTDESAGGFTGTGGMFRFAGNTGRQTLYGGYNMAANSGGSFPNLMIDNAAGVELGDLQDASVRNNLHFQNGHFFLNGWNLSAGNITGYSDRRFVVTGTAIAGGYLYLRGNALTFPIGTDENNYAPASLQNQGATETFRARVFDNVYQYAVSGNAMPDTFIYKTWNIGRMSGRNGTPLSLSFQHMNTAESATYMASRANSFVNHFENNAWEEQITTTSTGDLSTSTMQQAATKHAVQLDAGANEYFAKATRKSIEGTKLLILRFEADRLNPGSVGLLWTTWYEVNNLRFEIERRLENETTFKKVGEVASKGTAINELRALDYNTLDLNGFRGWSYYRLKAVLRDGTILYSEIRPVPPQRDVLVFPNPNYGKFKVRVNGYLSNMGMQLTNTWGQVLRQFNIEYEADIDVTGLPAATYFLVIYHRETGVIIHKSKVVVLK
ncbi:T9SS type A sorting domain-containing protein [Chitinophaga sp. SYP-B3965]|uniref:T9SS type A sorting domain-containing protein n=1 Tax=Chitinophaga sp. SYP-B3965 TaxID=2663120 RepID=UPI0012997661|nr:T9SS type A sorting domain-containing protein [Chitinophaga sp. SYP-B3965]MRG48570.1 T9SS type A sorting domain-containing protein [Chitinophaga sp. SYP-B3965]